MPGRADLLMSNVPRLSAYGRARRHPVDSGEASPLSAFRAA